MYKDVKVEVVSRVLEDETLAKQYVADAINDFLAKSNSPYRVAYVSTQEYPLMVKVIVCDSSDLEPDEDSMGLNGNQYDALLDLRVLLAKELGCKYIRFPGYYWSK